ncbi:MAG: response regulator transcription factor [Actinomycetota bacterium]|nr:response regulator transcription factor [Actinomycetota bacterium]
MRQSLVDAGFEVVAEVGDRAAALAAAVRERPDLCLLDVEMPGNGIRAASEILDRVPETAVVMLTLSRSDEDLFDALRAGAAGYLLKDTDPDRLPHALRGVLAGEAAVPRPLMSRVIDEFRTQGRRRRVALPGRRGKELSRREWEVLDLLREGRTTADIARRLFVSPVTVRRHVSAILRKLDVPDRQAAVDLLE